MRRYPVGAAWTVLLIAGMVMTGWILDVPTLKSAVPGLVEMKVNTAIAFAAAAIALLLQLDRPATGAALAAVRLCAALVAAIGGASLAEWVFAIDLGIDNLLFP